MSNRIQTRIALVGGPPPLMEVLAGSIGWVCSPHTFSTAWAFVEREEEEPFDAVLIWTDTPDLPGVELCRRIRSRPGAAGSLPVALVGHHDSPERLAFALKAGIDGFLKDPFTVRDLVWAVRYLLGLPHVRA